MKVLQVFGGILGTRTVCCQQGLVLHMSKLASLQPENKGGRCSVGLVLRRLPGATHLCMMALMGGYLCKDFELGGM
jgi:hypothetical protein